ncbi:MAG: hypothetical protein PF638_08520 [Candidatus Delongbacteria bacterium]|jgi:hypothetical protein|nr:hypothetical protein [Candidatus Delongbacteria bacterium]
MEEKNKAELELEFIKNIIHDSRRKVNDTGLSSVIWGTLVVIGIMTNYFSGIFHNWDYALYIWGILMASGWIYTFLEIRNAKKNNIPETFGLKVQNALWRASGIIMTIIALVCSFQFKRDVSDLVPYSYIINSMAIAPIISLILGAAYYVTGYINDCKYTTRLAYGWWIGGIVLFYMKSYNTFLIFALMTILFQILPGIRFYRRSKES